MRELLELIDDPWQFAAEVVVFVLLMVAGYGLTVFVWAGLS